MNTDSTSVLSPLVHVSTGSVSLVILLSFCLFLCSSSWLQGQCTSFKVSAAAQHLSFWFFPIILSDWHERILLNPVTSPSPFLFLLLCLRLSPILSFGLFSFSLITLFSVPTFVPSHGFVCPHVKAGWKAFLSSDVVNSTLQWKCLVSWTDSSCAAAVVIFFFVFCFLKILDENEKQKQRRKSDLNCITNLTFLLLFLVSPRLHPKCVFLQMWTNY